MATVKERKLIREITDLALDVNMMHGEYTIATSYIGHIHAFEVRVLDKDLNVQGDPYQWAHLSGGETELWDDKQAIESLQAQLHIVKTYHPQFDADGVKL